LGTVWMSCGQLERRRSLAGTDHVSRYSGVGSFGQERKRQG
jgi:hypothetical protein